MSIKSSVYRPLALLMIAGVVSLLVTAVATLRTVADNEMKMSNALAVSAEAHNLHLNADAMFNYTHDIAAMTKLVPAETIAREFKRFSDRFDKGLTVLDSAAQTESMRKLVADLRRQTTATQLQSARVLGVMPTPVVPTAELLQRHLDSLEDLLDETAMLATAEARQFKATAKAELMQTLLTAAAATLALLLLAASLAYKSANRLSGAMTTTTTEIMELAEAKIPKGWRKVDEFNEVKAALNILRERLDERQKITADLERATVEATAATIAKSDFLANMSHEIRTPMNGIIGVCELLEESELNDEQRSYARTIAQSGHALLTIINDILDFSKVEAGKFEIRNEVFNLNDVLFDCANLLSARTGEKGLEVVIDLPPDFPQWIMGDSGRLRQILMNLLGNALKFTPAGLVVVKVGTSHANGEDSVDISVQDTGVGIPADKLKDVFDVFTQLDNKSTREFGGTGLGLAISQRMAGLMGGTISVTSEPGKGSEFAVHLPLRVADAPEGENSLHATPSVKGLSALVVDDLEVNRRILTRRLSGWGGTVRTADSAAAAINLVDAETQRGRTFDFAIFDDRMPQMDGIQLHHILRQRYEDKLFPVILMTSADGSATASLGQDAGFASVLVKPVPSAELAQAIANAVGDSVMTAIAEPPVRSDDKALFAGKRILLAEDNKTNQMVLTSMLSQTGVDVAICSNGQEAVDYVAKNAVDLVLMDVSMPVKSGLTATEEIREREKRLSLDRCPIIALTANAYQSDRDACERAGMDGFLTKPVLKQKLLQYVGQYLDPSEAAAPQKRSAS